MVGLACLLQSHLLTVGIGLRIWWVLRVWLGNCSLAELTPINADQSYPRERGTAPIIWNQICDAMPIISRMAEMVGKNLLEWAGFPRNTWKWFAPKRTGCLTRCLNGHLKHIKLLSHFHRYLLTFQGIPDWKGETWHGVSCDCPSSILNPGFRVQCREQQCFQAADKFW